MTSANEAIRLGQEMGYCILQGRFWLRSAVILIPVGCVSILYGDKWLIAFFATLAIGSILFVYHYKYRSRQLLAEIQRKGPVK